MPNHVKQRLTALGTAEQLNQLMKTTKFTTTIDGMEKVLDFSENAFFPMPAELANTLSGANAILSRQEYDKFMADEENVEFHRKHELGFPITVEMAKEFQEKYGATNWYEWATRNWGTKWGTYDATSWKPTDGGITITFLSAWSPALPIIQRLSAIYPEITLVLEYADEGYCFAGRDTFKGGITLASEEIDANPDNPDFIALFNP